MRSKSLKFLVIPLVTACAHASPEIVTPAPSSRVVAPPPLPAPRPKPVEININRMLIPARAEDAGMRSTSLDSLDGLILQQLRAGAAPGASIAIARHGRIVKQGGYGVLDLRPGFSAVTDSTIYDLASLTKVIGTTTAIMMLIDDGLLRLDAPVKEYLPEWAGSPEKEAVTLRNLLLHNSGLAAGGDVYRRVASHDGYVAAIAGIDLTYAPGTKTVYSDYGGMIMGFIVERVSGKPLDVFLQERLFGPLGMRETGFNPLRWDNAGLIRDRIAPTEFSATIGRGAPLQGIVHDENAYAMGGVSGHAGLFSSARDLAVFAQMMLNHGYYNGRRYIRSATIDTFTHRFSFESSRALGWDTPAPNASAGDYFTPSSYGHTGYTGTSIWIDPERDLFVILLTNRVNPTRDNQKHLALRRAVSDQVQQAIADMPVTRRVDFKGPPAGR
jgi:CubicO group peptidase (beta-lactamase class C family)